MATNKTVFTGNLSRRTFVKNAAQAAAAFTIVPRFTLGGKGFIAPSDTVYIAGIGVGGKGKSDLTGFAKNPAAKIILLCDVDDRMAAESRKNFPAAKYYKDFRVMLDKEHKSMDAVSVSTPDHTHAVAAMAAMQRGKHVYVQKPLTYSIYEARMLAEAAKKYKVVTQMGNQYASADHVRKAKEIVDAGLIGEVTACTIPGLTDPYGHRVFLHRLENMKFQKNWTGISGLGLHHSPNIIPAYLPFNWRGWWNFGTGALGDMACHIMDAAFRILPIDYPTEVECSATTAWSGFFEEANYNGKLSGIFNHSPEISP